MFYGGCEEDVKFLILSMLFLHTHVLVLNVKMCICYKIACRLLTGLYLSLVIQVPVVKSMLIY